MKISAAFGDALRVYKEHFGTTIRFLTVEACMTLAAFAPLLFLVDGELKILAMLAIPFYLFLVLWARVNAAAAMRDAMNGGSLFSYRLVETDRYGKKTVYGLKRCLMLLFWSAPLIASLIIAKIHISGDMDGFTLLRIIKDFGGGDLMTGVVYLALIFAATVLLLAFGCAFHSGDRHAFVRDNPKLVKGHHGGIVLCWLCSLAALLPMIIAVVAVIIRYLPAIQDLNGIVTKTTKLPGTKITVIILAAGAVLTLPLLPLRSLIPAAFMNGLEKE
jgi:Ca2+/Na+ antiporter